MLDDMKRVRLLFPSHVSDTESAVSFCQKLPFLLLLRFLLLLLLLRGFRFFSLLLRSRGTPSLLQAAKRYSICLFPFRCNRFFFSLSVSGRFLPFELHRITSPSASHGAVSKVNRFLDFHRFSLPLSPFESADELQPFFFHRSRNEKSLALRASPLPWKRSSDPFTVSCNQREETSGRMHISFSFIVYS